MEFWGISRDLPESELNRPDLKRVTFVFAPAVFRESGENIEFMKVSSDTVFAVHRTAYASSTGPILNSVRSVIITSVYGQKSHSCAKVRQTFASGSCWAVARSLLKRQNKKRTDLTFC